MTEYVPLYKEEIMERRRLRPYATVESKGRRYDEPKKEGRSNRGEFQKDKDRIIHSFAFRRLMYKTQVFVTQKSDYIRTRLTHSLEVSQIARGIARSLGANEDLTEAIALGHDLGHTPFGHAVEKVLGNKLNNERGFLHNEQSVRVVDYLEHKSPIPEGYGLNLTWEVREGILKHTNVSGLVYDDLEPRKHSSLEGQIVYISDKIAYLCHDLQDSKKQGIFDELIKLDVIKQGDYDNIWEMFEASKEWGTSSIIDRLVNDVINGSITNLNKYSIETPDEIREIGHKIVWFEKYEGAYEYLKKFMGNYVYKNPLAQRMDRKAEKLAGEIFELFNENRSLLPLEHLIKLQNAHRDTSGQNGYQVTPSRVIADYIASMTDRFAIKVHSALFKHLEDETI